MTTGLPPNRLHSLREAAGLHRVEVAAPCKVGERTVRRWENGEQPIPTKFLPVLTELLDVTADHLLGFDRGRQKETV